VLREGGVDRGHECRATHALADRPGKGRKRLVGTKRKNGEGGCGRLEWWPAHVVADDGLQADERHVRECRRDLCSSRDDPGRCEIREALERCLELCRELHRRLEHPALRRGRDNSPQRSEVAAVLRQLCREALGKPLGKLLENCWCDERRERREVRA